jgi:hypothetical protein
MIREDPRIRPLPLSQPLSRTPMYYNEPPFSVTIMAQEQAYAVSPFSRVKRADG